MFLCKAHWAASGHEMWYINKVALPCLVDLAVTVGSALVALNYSVVIVRNANRASSSISIKQYCTLRMAVAMVSVTVAVLNVLAALPWFSVFWLCFSLQRLNPRCLLTARTLSWPVATSLTLFLSPPPNMRSRWWRCFQKKNRMKTGNVQQVLGLLCIPWFLVLPPFKLFLYRHLSGPAVVLSRAYQTWAGRSGSANVTILNSSLSSETPTTTLMQNRSNGGW